MTYVEDDTVGKEGIDFINTIDGELLVWCRCKTHVSGDKSQYYKFNERR